MLIHATNIAVPPIGIIALRILCFPFMAAKYIGKTNNNCPAIKDPAAILSGIEGVAIKELAKNPTPVLLYAYN
jgi:hypothetical protein